MNERILEFESSVAWMQRQVGETAEKHGFHDHTGDPLYIPTALALISSEVYEALAAHRNGEDDHLPEELADVVIRVMDLASVLGVDLGTEIIHKAVKNETRTYKHGNKRY